MSPNGRLCEVAVSGANRCLGGTESVVFTLRFRGAVKLLLGEVPLGTQAVPPNPPEREGLSKARRRRHLGECHKARTFYAVLYAALPFLSPLSFFPSNSNNLGALKFKENSLMRLSANFTYSSFMSYPT